MSNDNLVPEPQPSVFDAVNGVLQDEEAARRVMANPALAKGFPNGRPIEHSAASGDDTCACGGHHGKCGCQDDEQSDGSEIPIKAIDDIGRATAEDVREALHQVIDPELGIDVIDLGLVYGIEIDELGRAIITMTLTTPACPSAQELPSQVEEAVRAVEGVSDVQVEVVWDPPWDQSRMSEDARLALNMF